MKWILNEVIYKAIIQLETSLATFVKNLKTTILKEFEYKVSNF